jgi:hypothetical protein
MLHDEDVRTGRVGPERAKIARGRFPNHVLVILTA